jgi:hypothetical protein
LHRRSHALFGASDLLRAGGGDGRGVRQQRAELGRREPLTAKRSTMSKLTVVSIATVLGLACLAASKPAEAFTYSTHNGAAIKHQAAFKMFRDRCSMPDGNGPAWAYWDAGWQWGQIQNRMDWQWYYNSGCYIEQGNGRSETARVPRAAISGRNGYTVCQRDGTRLLECDVMLADDMHFAEPTEYRSSDQGYATITHEFGHVLGLQHTNLLNGYNLMRIQTPYPVTGGRNVQPMRDDYEGIKFLYGDLGGHNLYVTALDTGLNALDTGTKTRCRGGTFSMRYAVLHNGVGPATSLFRIFVQKTSTGEQTNLFSGSATVDLGFIETRTFTVPSSLSNGDYYIKWEIDSGGFIDEWNEGDNLTRSGAILRVTDC